MFKFSWYFNNFYLILSSLIIGYRHQRCLCQSMIRHYHIKKDVLYVFFCSIETSEISKGKQMKTAVGVYPLCIYTWHRCAFSFRGEGASCAIIYTELAQASVASYSCSQGRPRTSIDKDNVSSMIPAPFLLVVHLQLCKLCGIVAG